MSNDIQQKVVFAFSQGKVPRHQRAVHGKALNPSMGAPTPLIDGLGFSTCLDFQTFAGA